MRVASLFTGAAGLDLGLGKAGHQHILLCESDPGARQVLREAWPGVLMYNDVANIVSLPETTELLAAGFPCVDISRAGLKAGVDGQSSGLVRHVFRLLAVSNRAGHPVPWVLLENVEALLDRTAGRPAAVQSIADAFEGLGYRTWAYRTICSAGFAVPNRRKRVFFLASMHGDARDVLLSTGMHRCMGACTAGLNVPGQGVLGRRPCYECYESALGDQDDPNRLDGVSMAMDLGNARSSPGVDIVPCFTTSNSRICLALADGQVGMLRIQDAERLQGFPEGWTEPCWPVRGDNTAHHRSLKTRDQDVESREKARFVLLGNAVTVQVATWIGEQLKNLYRHKYIRGPTEQLLPHELQSWVHVMSPEEWQDLRDLQAATTGTLHSMSRRARDQAGKQAKRGKKGGADTFALPRTSVTASRGVAADGSSSSDDSQDDDCEEDGMATTAAAAGDEAPQAVRKSTDDDRNKDGEEAEEEEGAAAEVEDEDQEEGDKGVDGGDGGEEDSEDEQEGVRKDRVNDMPAIPAADDSGDADATSTSRCSSSSTSGSSSSDEESGWAVARRPGTVRRRVRAAGKGRGPPGSRRSGRAVKPTNKSMPHADGTLAAPQRRPRRPSRRAIPRLGAGRLTAPPAANVGPPLWHALLSQAELDDLAQAMRWPRCAWYVQGVGRYGVEDVSEAPVKGPYVPLGDFIRRVGRLPDPTALSTYFSRLRANGWQIEHIVAQMIKGGHQMLTEDLKASKLKPDGDNAVRPEQLGRIVWAVDPARFHAHWPAQAFDPLNLPPGVEITAEQAATLRIRERKLFLPAKAPGTGVVGPPDAPGTASTLLAAASADVNGEATGPTDVTSPSSGVPTTPTPLPDKKAAPERARASTGDTAAPSTSNAAETEPSSKAKAKAAAAGSGDDGDGEAAAGEGALGMKRMRRKWLCVFFGAGGHIWVWQDELHDFEDHKEEAARVMADLLDKGLVRRATVKKFQKAVEDAEAAVGLKAQLHLKTLVGGGGTGTPESAELKVLVQGVLKESRRSGRCGDCETCNTTANAPRKRCLEVRAATAAAAGHIGAQLAVLGLTAVGARVSVWWPLDEAWYNGHITDFERVRKRHTVSYDDGDVEIIPLWAPNQLIRVHNRPADWPDSKARLQRDRDTALKRAADEKTRARRELEERREEAKVEYECEREARIQRNAAQRQEMLGEALAAAQRVQAAVQARAAAQPGAAARVRGMQVATPFQNTRPPKQDGALPGMQDAQPFMSTPAPAAAAAASVVGPSVKADPEVGLDSGLLLPAAGAGLPGATVGRGRGKRMGVAARQAPPSRQTRSWHGVTFSTPVPLPPPPPPPPVPMMLFGGADMQRFDATGQARVTHGFAGTSHPPELGFHGQFNTPALSDPALADLVITDLSIPGVDMSGMLGSHDWVTPLAAPVATPPALIPKRSAAVLLTSPSWAREWPGVTPCSTSEPAAKRHARG